MSDYWNQTAWNGITFRSVDGGYLVKSMVRLPTYIPLSEFLATVQRMAEGYVGDPEVSTNEDYGTAEIVLDGERHATNAEIQKIEAYLNRKRATATKAKARKADAELREYERLKKKFGE